MEEADKDWMMIRMVGGWMFLLVPAHPGSPGQRAVKRSLLLLFTLQFTFLLHTPFAAQIWLYQRRKVRITEWRKASDIY